MQHVGFKIRVVEIVTNRKGSTDQKDPQKGIIQCAQSTEKKGQKGNRETGPKNLEKRMGAQP